MKIIIHCSEDQACAIRDALHNYYHEALPLKSKRCKFLAESCKIAADYISQEIQLNMRLITVWIGRGPEDGA
jgi:hypothetical protein